MRTPVNWRPSTHLSYPTLKYSGVHLGTLKYFSRNYLWQMLRLCTSNITTLGLIGSEWWLPSSIFPKSYLWQITDPRVYPPNFTTLADVRNSKYPSPSLTPLVKSERRLWTVPNILNFIHNIIHYRKALNHFVINFFLPFRNCLRVAFDRNSTPLKVARPCTYVSYIQ